MSIKILIKVGDLVKIADDNIYRFGVGIVLEKKADSLEVLTEIAKAEFPLHSTEDLVITDSKLLQNEVFLVLWQGPVGTGEPRPIWLFHDELELAY